MFYKDCTCFIISRTNGPTKFCGLVCGVLAPEKQLKEAVADPLPKHLLFVSLKESVADPMGTVNNSNKIYLGSGQHGAHGCCQQ